MNLLDRIRELIAHDEPFCLATVLTSTVSGVEPGRQIIIRRDGAVEGATGMADLDAAIARTARTCFEQRRKASVDIAPGLLVFFDLPAQSAQLIICGAGHIAVPLARYAGDSGFAVTVIDDREDFASPERFPGCEVVARDFMAALREAVYGPSTHVVVITRGHEHDADCLAEVLRHETAYVGLIGSRRRVRFVLELLGRQGIPRERLQEVFTPIGIPIGAESPEEIAISIMAELVCVRRKGPQQAVTLRESIR
jgi:xanthine dehydrogenase accessory factor